MDPKIYTVSELSRGIKSLLENSYSEIWVEGEISGLKVSSLGHAYFDLKDEVSNISGVLFRGFAAGLKFELENGLLVRVRGNITTYDKQSKYQLMAREVRPAGLGPLQLAFERLKKKLQAEGLFDPARKRPVPALPQKIAVVTSPTGAAIRDILSILKRRYANLHIIIAPVKVQGAGAKEEIAQAISDLNDNFPDIDVMLVGRGGGSAEDLWAFNEEIVARAIAGSKIPVISCVGHETDFTIADFVADVRAPTPSAAAEIVVPNRADLIATVQNHAKRLEQAVVRNFPQRMMQIDGLRERLQYSWQVGWNQHNDYLKRLMSNLDHLSPLHILGKGYSVVTREGSTTPLKSARGLKENDPLQIRFAEGHVQAQVVK